MKVVLDTNVLVSGLLQPYSIPAEIVRMVSSGVLQLYHDSRILSEYREVLLRPKFSFRESDVEHFLNQVMACGQAVAARPLGFSLPDSDDEVFLEVALSGKAPFLITGNLKHYAVYTGKELKILSPFEFLRVYQE